jgi:hypothetical protein
MDYRVRLFSRQGKTRGTAAARSKKNPPQRLVILDFLSHSEDIASGSFGSQMPMPRVQAARK